ncbi:hypothetical protein SBRCBS47491_004261 [Sporothrix bragantina]|uniref:FAD-binding domain-containing protein n=1 Tax=Sporothrix bragantina TaxID=671064 RepID=A0ABP0BM41_9PEZI
MSVQEVAQRINEASEPIAQSPPSLPPQPSQRLPPYDKPLDVIVVGAGIGGLTAAISLRRAGHNVQIFEQSQFKEELGAALHVCANASRSLLRLGLNAERLNGVPCRGSLVFKGDGTPILEHWNGDIVKEYGAQPWWLAHRIDLHSELRRLAVDAEGQGKPAQLHLGCPVAGVNYDVGEITLKDGTTHKADLIIGADGVHSVLRETAFSPEKAVTTGSRAFRFVVDAAEVDNNPDTLHPTHGTCHAFIESDRRFVLYPCRNNTLYNCVLIVQDGTPDQIPTTGWRSDSTIDDVLKEFTYPQFSRKLINIIKKTKSVKCWQLLKRSPIDCWVNGRLCLVGDAAHPMLPYQGQGGGQAIEDGCILGVLFPMGTSPDNVPQILKLYNQARYKRASIIQMISSSEETSAPVVATINVEPFIMSHDCMEYAKQLRSTELIV